MGTMLHYLKLNREFECLYLIDMCIIYFVYLSGNQNFLSTC